METNATADTGQGLSDDEIRALIAFMQRQAEVQAGPDEEEEPRRAAQEVLPEEEYQPFERQTRRSRPRTMSDPASRSLAAVLALLERLRSQQDPTLPEQDNEEYLRRMLDHYIRQAGLSHALTAHGLMRGGEPGE